MYTRLLARFPDDKLAVNARYMAGFTAFGQGDFPTALKHAEAFLAAYPDDERAADTLYVAAESHLQLGQYVEADRLFAVLLRKHSNHADANIWKVRYASSLYLQKKYAEAVALLQPLPAGLRTPDALAEAHYLLGGSQVELNEFEAAAKSLEASLAAQPKWRQADDALLLLARAYTGLKNGQKARATLEKLIAQFPDSRLLDRAHYRLGEIAYAGSDFQTATAEYQQVIDRWPQSPMAPHALYGLGWTKLGQNDFAAAEKVFDRWVREYPDHTLAPRVRYARGVARHELKNFAGAIDDIQALLESGPTRAEKSDARYLLGLCQSALQKYADAAATFQSLLADDPKYAAADKALYELAWALKRQDKEKQAAEVFARLAAAYAGSPLTAEAQYRVGQYSEQSGDLKNAAAAYHAAWQAAGRFAQTDLADKAAFSEGESLWKQKTFADALAAYEQVKEPAGKDFELLALLHAGQAAAEVRNGTRAWDS